MKREDKIKLLQAIAEGKKKITDLLPTNNVLIKTHSKFRTTLGKEYKLDFSDCPEYLLNGTIAILPENGHESY